MKKALSYSTAVILALSLICAPALAAPEAGDVIGEWFLISMEMEGLTINPASFGLEMSLALSDGGEASLFATGEDVMIGTWSIEGGQVIVDAGDALAFDYTDEGKLVCDQDGSKLYFSRDQSDSILAEASPILTGAALADFDGAWRSHEMDITGTRVPAEAMGFDIDLSIQGGTVKFAVLGVEEELQGSFADGALTVVADSDGEERTMAFVLHEDGTLSTEIEGFRVYFKSVD